MDEDGARVLRSGATVAEDAREQLLEPKLLSGSFSGDAAGETRGVQDSRMPVTLVIVEKLGCS